MSTAVKSERSPEGGSAFKFTNVLLQSAGLILLLTGTAKVASVNADSELYKQLDPLLGLSFHSLFMMVGGLEIAIGAFCFFGRNILLRTVWLGGLASVIVAYRFGLWLIEYKKPCSCLGSFADRLRLSPQAADMLMVALLAYLLGVAVFALITQRQHALREV